MTVMTVRNLPEEVRRALRVRAAQHGHSTEAEVRAILEEAVRPPGRMKLGSLLAEVGRHIHLTDAELALINGRDKSGPRPVNLE
jgi:plasmid stability protein